ncbi:hypothetical protein Peur_045236 [Populus x canadensis]
MSNRLARWQVSLAEYDIIYKTRKSVKGSAIADHLADNAIEDYEPLNFDFPDEDVLVIERDCCTNNTAEYEACIHGLEAALELKIGKLEVYGDSMLIICQTKGE